MKRAAYASVALLVLVMAAAATWPLIAPELGVDADAVRIVMWGALVPAVVMLLIVATAQSARPIKRRTGYDGTMMMFVAWFFLVFAVFMPVVIISLGVSISLFSGRLGGATISTGNQIPGTGTYYPPIRLSRGETYPLAFVYLAMALIWPAVVFAAIATVFG